MLFTSLTFLVFLPLVLLLYSVLPLRQRWLCLLLASYVFYAASGFANVALLAAVTLLVYGCGWGMGQADRAGVRRALLLTGVLSVLGLMILFKFYDFLAGEIEQFVTLKAETDLSFALPRLGMDTPAGYSFYAFAAVSYLVDVYVGRLAAEGHAGRLALYIGYFPKIFAGPIERATTFLPQVRGRMRVEPELLVSGMQLIGWGLFKKVVIADNLAVVVDRNFAIAAFASPIELLLSAYFFAFQIYCDFSGYTDIAIGVSLLFGIKLMENFRRPYLARSTAEFWGQRWHISLGRWFRDYLYIPLGGSKTGTVRRYANVMGVFVLSGLWHAGLGYGVGWTFLLWGALNGFYQWVGLATASFWHQVGERLPRLSAGKILLVGRIVLTFHLIAIAWVFFRAASVSDALLILEKIWNVLGQIPGLITRYPFTGEHYFGVGLIAFLMAVEIFDERCSIWKRLAAAPRVVRWAVYYAGIFALLFLGRWEAREFIYMQF